MNNCLSFLKPLASSLVLVSALSLTGCASSLKLDSEAPSATPAIALAASSSHVDAAAANDSAVANMTALLANSEAIPLVSERCRVIYKDDWLSREKPRAFVVEKGGRCFSAWGTKPSNVAEASDPAERAMKRCKAAGSKACAIYAQDDQVVYQAAR
jgi:hypothetical protein